MQAAAPAWQPFTWHVDSFAGGPPEPVALFLPARIDGAPCLVQLDTGANGELMWAGAADGATAKRLLTVELAGIRRQVWADGGNVRYVTPQVCALRAVATVGNAFFEHGTLTLDLGNARFAFSPGPTLASNPAAHPCSMPAGRPRAATRWWKSRLPAGRLAMHCSTWVPCASAWPPRTPANGPR
ncbi:hypothetical protein [Pseudoduganella buxea]|nr:hypothetical protein [Pseudoduganella buxea]MTV53561.1 hypothetical protein [Pseudoduganella buxea]